jgi:ABC-2 type transport system permease protein
MTRGLWLLMWLRLWGWLRRLGRSLGSVRGILLVVVGALVFVPWVLTWVLGDVPFGQHTAEVRRYGPLVLAGYCVLELLISTGGAITFSAAEVNFLFPGPLSRRQLLAYKVTATFGSSLLSTALLTLFLRQYALTLAGAVVGLLLAALFVQLFPMALALIASSLGARAYDRRRKIVLLVLAVLVAVALAGALRGRGGRELLAELERSEVAQTLLAPFRWFVSAFTAERLWPDLAQWASLGLLVNACLLAVVFALDAHYLEASAAASERAYARLQRLRQGGPAMASAPASGWARLSVPALPACGGVGAIAWRQLVTVVRSPRSLLVALIVTGMIVYSALAGRDRPGQPESSGWFVLILLGLLALIIPPLMPFDFRGDLDRMDVLKTLPLPAWRLVVGQLLVPVLLVSLLQVILLAILMSFGEGVDPLLLGGAAFVLPLNFLLFGIDNLLFLWFPTRQAHANPGDLQTMGRQMLLYMAKFFALVVMILVAFLFGGAVCVLTGMSVMAGAVVGWLVLAGFVVGLVPLIALAFNRFDVARDTP